jgi:hypothetical protein
MTIVFVGLTVELTSEVWPRCQVWYCAWRCWSSCDGVAMRIVYAETSGLEVGLIERLASRAVNDLKSSCGKELLALAAGSRRRGLYGGARSQISKRRRLDSVGKSETNPSGTSRFRNGQIPSAVGVLYHDRDGVIQNSTRLEDNVSRQSTRQLELVLKADVASTDAPKSV